MVLETQAEEKTSSWGKYKKEYKGLEGVEEKTGTWGRCGCEGVL